MLLSVFFFFFVESEHHADSLSHRLQRCCGPYFYRIAREERKEQCIFSPTTLSSVLGMQPAMIRVASAKTEIKGKQTPATDAMPCIPLRQTMDTKGPGYGHEVVAHCKESCQRCGQRRTPLCEIQYTFLRRLRIAVASGQDVHLAYSIHHFLTQLSVMKQHCLY